MNIVSVQIYSDQNTPWDRSKIDFPINIENTNWPGNGCGLCNQIFKIINTVIYNKTDDIYIDLLAKDTERGDSMLASEILNFKKIRSKYGYKLYDIMDLDYNSNYSIKTYPYVYMSYNNNKEDFIKMVKSLIFNDKYEDISNSIIFNKGLSDKIVNIVHLRIDTNMKNHIIHTAGLPSYLNLIENYRREIYLNCDKSIPLVLSLEETDHPFVNELKKDYDVYTFEKSDVLNVDSSIDGSEIFAHLDFLTAKNLNVNNFIGWEGSSFSILLYYLIESKKSIILK
jgi:hypothetical protein